MSASDASAIRGTSPYQGDQFVAGTIDAAGNKMYGDGFLAGILATGVYFVLTGTTIFGQDECSMMALEVGSARLAASVRWSSGNVFVVSLMDDAGALTDGTVAFAVEDA